MNWLHSVQPAHIPAHGGAVQRIGLQLTPISAADIKGHPEVIQSDGVTLTTAAPAASRYLSGRIV